MSGRLKEPPDPMESMWAWLAHDLRFFRLKHKLSGEQFGRIIGVVRSTVSRLESGELKIDEEQARALDTRFNTGGHFFRLLWYARLGHDPDWFKEHVSYEARASILKIYELSLVPGLLQTEDYARALFKGAGVKDVEADVATRMSRQATLSREQLPFLWVLLDQGVLHRMVAEVEVMRAQTLRLLEVAEQANVSLRVVPASAGFHLGLEGSFKILTVDEGDVAYTEATEGGRLVRSAPEVRVFHQRYDRIGAKALPEDSSRSLIEQALETMR